MTTTPNAYGIVDNALEYVEDELREAARLDAEAKARKAQKSEAPVLLWLSPECNALIRPVHDLKIMLIKHDKYNSDPMLKVNCICVAPMGVECELCKRAKEEKDNKLVAQKYFYLPVYVKKVYKIQGREEVLVTYDRRNEDGSVTKKPVQGFRLIELTRKGVIAPILQQFLDYSKDEEYNFTLTGNDFIWSQTGEKETKNYNLRPKMPKPIPDELKASIPPLQNFLEKIIEYLTPKAPIPAAPAPMKQQETESLGSLDDGYEYPF